MPLLGPYATEAAALLACGGSGCSACCFPPAVPTTLYAHFSGTGTGCNLTMQLTWDGEQWEGGAVVGDEFPLGGCGGGTIVLRCSCENDVATWELNIDIIVGFASEQTCSPFYALFNLDDTCGCSALTCTVTE